MPAYAKTRSIRGAGGGKKSCSSAALGDHFEDAEGSRPDDRRGFLRIQSHDQAQEDAWERSSRPPSQDARERWPVPGHDVTAWFGLSESGGAHACLPRAKVSMIVMRSPQHGHSGRWSGGALCAYLAVGAGTASRRVRNSRRNSLPNTRTGSRKAGRDEISAGHRARSRRQARSRGCANDRSAPTPKYQARP